MPKKKQDDVAEALDLLRDANLESAACSDELDKLINNFFTEANESDSDSDTSTSNTSDIVDLDSVQSTGNLNVLVI